MGDLEPPQHFCCVLGHEDEVGVFDCGKGHYYCMDCVDLMAKDPPKECPQLLDPDDMKSKCCANFDLVRLGKFVPEDNQEVFQQKLLDHIQVAAPRDGEKSVRCDVCNLYIEVEGEHTNGPFTCQHQFEKLFQVVLNFPRDDLFLSFCKHIFTLYFFSEIKTYAMNNVRVLYQGSAVLIARRTVGSKSV